MGNVVLKAHYDGEKIRLDEPFDLSPNAKLLVIVVPEDLFEQGRQAWLALSQAGLARAYGDDEPDYLGLLSSKRPPAE